MDFKQIDIKLLDINPSGIVIIRTDGSISYANKKAAETLGLSASLISERSYNSPE
ncbi:PAS domain-containing protein [Balneola sp. MJW-20]|uniref:PAS domain-containing protein n=1 Tax=Gracilimonas aurantiaca TaxID=3234185 RepID=UPI003466949C